MKVSRNRCQIITHVIITRQKDYKASEGCLLAVVYKETISCVSQRGRSFHHWWRRNLQTIHQIADKIDLTHVHTTINADTFSQIDEINGN